MRTRKNKTKTTTNKEVEPVVKKYKVEQLIKTDKYLGYRDILSALFNSQDYVTEAQIDKALKQHLEREV